METTPHQTQQGYIIITLVMIISLLSLVIIIPIIKSTNNNFRNSSKAQQSNEVFYGVEASIHDIIAKIIASNFNWPPSGPTAPESLQVNNINIEREINKDSTTGVIQIQTTGEYRDISRTFNVNIGTDTVDSNDSVELILAIDISGSMDNESEFSIPPQFPCDNGSQPACQPLDAAREAAKGLIDSIFTLTSKVKISIVTFNNEATVNLPLADANSSSPTVVKAVIDQIKINPALPRTNIGDAFNIAQQQLDNSTTTTAYKVIVLLSDGSANSYSNTTAGGPYECDPQPITHNNCSSSTTHPTIDPQSAIGQAQNAKNKGYYIFTIGLNLIRLDPNAHAIVARDTLLLSASQPEYYFDSPSSTQLNAIFANIIDEILLFPKFVITEQY